MSETEHNADTTTEDTTATDGDRAEAAKAADDGKTFSQSELDRVVEQRLARERAKFADYDQIKADAAELAKIRDAEKTELQRAVERAEEAEKRVTEAEYKALRNKIAADRGVPASSLTGSTEDELTASADELIAWRDQNKSTQTTAPKRINSGGLKSGASGTGNSNPDPKVRAAEALRQLRTVG